jgi:hypothetical protein
LFLGSGCSMKNNNNNNFGLKNPVLEEVMEIKFREFQEQGISYIEANPQYEETRKSIIKGYERYKTIFASDHIAKCQAVSLGLQFILLEETEKDFIEWLLAASAKDKYEFYRMSFWVKDQKEVANFFLHLLREDKSLGRAVQQNDLKDFDSIARERGVNMCAPRTALDLLREFGSFR